MNNGIVIMACNIILFGAGASYGSDRSGVPPLGFELFDVLVSFNKNGWGQIPSNLAEKFRNDFEDGMRNLSKSNPHLMPILQRAMAAYFYNFIPQPNNLYRKIARLIFHSSWDGILATINYERLLQLSLAIEGLKPIVNLRKTNQNEIELILPHGCCDLFCESAFGFTEAVSLNGTAVTTNGPIKVILDPYEFHSRIQNDAFPPVMSYFEPEKKTTSGLSFIENQRSRFMEIVSQASIVGIVGVKVRIEDNHIWEPLAKTSARLIYCSGERSGQEFHDWCNQNRPDNQDVILDGIFSECFDRFCKEINIIHDN